MSGVDLDAIEARAKAAPSGSRCVCSWQMEQARYIAHAREDVPALVAEVRRLRKVVESLEGFPFTESRKWGTQ